MDLSQRKLLVLDVNGLLVDTYFREEPRPEETPDAIVGNFHVYKRPYCDQFLQFCFENFLVGIWSSARKHNVRNLINFVFGEAKNKLAFTWHQLDCTDTGLKAPENECKPLFLKELSKLWKGSKSGLPWNEGEYGPTNTLLVDDTPYKALRNPPNTAIFPQPYSAYDVGDNLLGDALRVYLEGLRDAVDVQKYVESNPFGEPSITSASPYWNIFSQLLDVDISIEVGENPSVVALAIRSDEVDGALQITNSKCHNGNGTLERVQNGVMSCGDAAPESPKALCGNSIENKNDFTGNTDNKIFLQKMSHEQWTCEEDQPQSETRKLKLILNYTENEVDPNTAVRSANEQGVRSHHQSSPQKTFIYSQRESLYAKKRKISHNRYSDEYWDRKWNQERDYPNEEDQPQCNEDQPQCEVDPGIAVISANEQGAQSHNQRRPFKTFIYPRHDDGYEKKRKTYRNWYSDEHLHREWSHEREDPRERHGQLHGTSSQYHRKRHFNSTKPCHTEGPYHRSSPDGVSTERWSYEVNDWFSSKDYFNRNWKRRCFRNTSISSASQNPESSWIWQGEPSSCCNKDELVVGQADFRRTWKKTLSGSGEGQSVSCNHDFDGSWTRSGKETSHKHNEDELVIKQVCKNRCEKRSSFSRHWRWASHRHESDNGWTWSDRRSESQSDQYTNWIWQRETGYESKDVGIRHAALNRTRKKIRSRSRERQSTDCNRELASGWTCSGKETNQRHELDSDWNWRDKRSASQSVDCNHELGTGWTSPGKERNQSHELDGRWNWPDRRSASQSVDCNHELGSGWTWPGKETNQSHELDSGWNWPDGRSATGSHEHINQTWKREPCYGRREDELVVGHAHLRCRSRERRSVSCNHELDRGWTWPGKETSRSEKEEELVIRRGRISRFENRASFRSRHRQFGSHNHELDRFENRASFRGRRGQFGSHNHEFRSSGRIWSGEGRSNMQGHELFSRQGDIGKYQKHTSGRSRHNPFLHNNYEKAGGWQENASRYKYGKDMNYS